MVVKKFASFLYHSRFPPPSQDQVSTRALDDGSKCSHGARDGRVTAGPSGKYQLAGFAAILLAFEHNCRTRASPAHPCQRARARCPILHQRPAKHHELPALPWRSRCSPLLAPVFIPEKDVLGSLCPRSERQRVVFSSLLGCSMQAAVQRCCCCQDAPHTSRCAVELLCGARPHICCLRGALLRAHWSTSSSRSSRFLGLLLLITSVQSLRGTRTRALHALREPMCIVASVVCFL